jgi:hypothetical protein
LTGEVQNSLVAILGRFSLLWPQDHHVVQQELLQGLRILFDVGFELLDDLATPRDAASRGRQMAGHAFEDRYAKGPDVDS